MVRKETLVQVAVVALSIAFAAVCVAVYLTRGNVRCIRAKLRLGALLLNLNGLVAAASGCIFTPTCYAVAMSDQMQITDPVPTYSNETGEAEIAINLDERTELQGMVYERQAEHFSYRICARPAVAVDAEPDTDIAAETAAVNDACADAANIVVQEDLVAADGAFDQYEEAFAIVLDQALPAGDYTLQLHPVAAADLQPATWSHYQYRLTIADIVKPLPK